MIANTILNNLQLGQGRLEKLQQQVSSGLKLSAPGDDPISAQQVIQLKGLLQDADQYTRNIAYGNSWLQQSDSAMADMGNVVTRARELAVGMANGTYTAKDRTITASELGQLKSQLIQLGNSQAGGKYIFGGFVSDTPPFDASGTFVGTDDAITMEVGRGAYVDVNCSGGNLLKGGTPPGVDIIKVLDDLTTALTNNDVSGIQAKLPLLDDSLNQILSARGDVGARMNRVQSASDNLDSMKLSLSKLLSSKQDVDILEVTSALTTQETAFQVALAASAKTAQLSLLDYLR
jgi:flagellar hook-associated protein 3 FlgL